MLSLGRHRFSAHNPNPHSVLGTRRRRTRLMLLRRGVAPSRRRYRGRGSHNRTAAATGGLREAVAPPTCALASTGDHPAAGRTNCFEYTDAMGEA